MEKGVWNRSARFSPDGRWVTYVSGRLIMIKPSEDELAERKLVIVENWFTERRRRVPTPREPVEVIE